ncbi:MAG: PilZ domain-containing protein [Candidatus Methylomirabilales bacterium]
MEEPTREQRRHPRWVIQERFTGRITASDDAALMDLSPGGAQIEYANIVPPGTVASLAFPVQGRTLMLQCRVVWSRAAGTQAGAAGEPEVVSRSGLQFLNLSDTAQHLLKQYLVSLRQEGPSPEPA